MEKRKRPRRKKILWMIGAAALLFALSVGLVNAQLRPALIELAKTRVQAIASDAMYEAVLGCINAQPEETSYVDILKTADQVYYVEINNKELSLLAANCARAVQKSLSQVGQQGVQVSLGTASGSAAVLRHRPYAAHDVHPGKQCAGRLYQRISHGRHQPDATPYPNENIRAGSHRTAGQYAIHPCGNHGACGGACHRGQSTRGFH